jgi:putative SOS response-associated peptidase YedK
MCGRFTAIYTWAELVALYRLTMPASKLQPRYNVCPMLKEFKLATFNAPSESVTEKATFH